MPVVSLVARAGIAVFVAVVALEHVLRPDVPPAQRFISEYGRGWTQPVHTLAFLAWAVAAVACLRLALRVRARRVARSLTASGFAVATAGTLLAAAFVTQTVGGEMPAGVERTLAGRLHDAGTLLILVGLLGAALASLRLVAVLRYRLVIAVLAFALVAMVSAMVLLGIDAPGVGQRGFVVIGCAFQWAFASSAGAATAVKRARAA